MNSPAPPEPTVEPDIPIVDVHHHLWVTPRSAIQALGEQETITAKALLPVYQANPRYVLDEYLKDIEASGHKIQSSVFVEAHSMYRTTGPANLRSVGEVEFANTVAALCDSGLFGETRVCAGIVGNVDLREGASVQSVLESHIAAANGRYRGLRSPIAYDEDTAILGIGGALANTMSDKGFMAGFSKLGALGLCFDAMILDPQLPDLYQLAYAFPDTSIVLNHMGAPLLVGRFKGQRRERFQFWRENIHKLAELPNVTCKLSGFGIPFWGSKAYLAEPRLSSTELASEWKPYIETCVEFFGVGRCMFGSNYPVDWSVACYRTLWNAYKLAVGDASDSEKRALFGETATRIYRLAQ